MKRLSEYRRAKGLQLKELAEALGLSGSLASKWEAYKCLPKAETAYRIDEALNLNIFDHDPKFTGHFVRVRAGSKKKAQLNAPRVGSDSVAYSNAVIAERERKRDEDRAAWQKAIVKAIEQSGLSVARFAEEIGVDIVTLRDWRGGNHCPGFRIRYELDEMLNMGLFEHDEFTDDEMRISSQMGI